MRERCVKIGSAGKMFALTGWKVGFICAAPALTAVIAKAHQFLTFTTPPNLQAAVAWGLENSDAWFAQMPRDLAASRDRLTEALRREGFAVLPSRGTYFLNVDLAASGIAEGDMDFCLRAVKEAGVAAIPISAFYEEAPVTHLIRLCFPKRDETLDEGARRLAKARDLSRTAHCELEASGRDAELALEGGDEGARALVAGSRTRRSRRWRRPRAAVIDQISRAFCRQASSVSPVSAGKSRCSVRRVAPARRARSREAGAVRGLVLQLLGQRQRAAVARQRQHQVDAARLRPEGRSAAAPGGPARAGPGAACGCLQDVQDQLAQQRRHLQHLRLQPAAARRAPGQM